MFVILFPLIKLISLINGPELDGRVDLPHVLTGFNQGSSLNVESKVSPFIELSSKHDGLSRAKKFSCTENCTLVVRCLGEHT